MKKMFLESHSIQFEVITQLILEMGIHQSHKKQS